MARWCRRRRRRRSCEKARRAESATDELERAGGDDEAEDALETTPKAGENGDGDGKKKLGHRRNVSDELERELETSTKRRMGWRPR